jgi:hypothetical protein
MAAPQMTTARDAILANLAKGRGNAKPVPDYILPGWTNDGPGHFIEKAKASVAEVHAIAWADDAPEAILSIIAANGLRPQLHLPKMSPLNALPWHRAPGLIITAEPPSGERQRIFACRIRDCRNRHTGLSLGRAKRFLMALPPGTRIRSVAAQQCPAAASKTLSRA